MFPPGLAGCLMDKSAADTMKCFSERLFISESCRSWVCKELPGTVNIDASYTTTLHLGISASRWLLNSFVFSVT
jgi:hypothetical protein